MMQVTLTSAMEEVGFSAAERAERLSRLHFVAAASLDALRASGGALVSAMLEAWPSYWTAVQAEAPAGANIRGQPCGFLSSCFAVQSAAWVLQCTSAALQVTSVTASRVSDGPMWKSVWPRVLRAITHAPQLCWPAQRKI